MRTVVYLIVLLAAMNLVGCADVPPVSTATTDGVKATSPLIGWMLPKTILQVDATYTFIGCRVENNTYQAKIKVTTTVTPSYVPDTNLGSRAPNGWIVMDVDKLHTFWQDHQIEVKTYSSSHLLQELSTTATDQTAQIVANVITSATKLASMAFGVPTGFDRQKTEGCMPGQKKVDLAKSLTKDLAVTDVSSAKGKRLTQQIQSIKASLTFTKTCLIDPGYFDNDCGDLIKNDPKNAKTIYLDNVATIAPDTDTLKSTGWFDNTQTSPDLSDFTLSVKLEFGKARPDTVVPCIDNATPCSRKRTDLDNGAFYRDPALIPVAIYQGTAADANKLLFTKAFFFGQFGVSRSVPTKSPTFGKAAWTLNFSESGEMTDTSYGSVAVGVNATSLLQSTSASASSFDANRIKGSQQLDSSTQSQQMENTKLQTIIQGATYRQQCEQLLAQGQVASCD